MIYILWYLSIGTIAWCMTVLLNMIMTALLATHFESKGMHIKYKIGFFIGGMKIIICKFAEYISKMGWLKAIFNIVLSIGLWPITIVLSIVMYIRVVIHDCSNYYK